MSLFKSKLHAHICEQQVWACRLEGVLEAIAALDNENLAPDAVTSLIHVALDIARDLNAQLDSAALPDTEAKA